MTSPERGGNSAALATCGHGSVERAAGRVCELLLVDLLLRSSGVAVLTLPDVRSGTSQVSGWWRLKQSLERSTGSGLDLAIGDADGYGQRYSWMCVRNTG